MPALPPLGAVVELGEAGAALEFALSGDAVRLSDGGVSSLVEGVQHGRVGRRGRSLVRSSNTSKAGMRTRMPACLFSAEMRTPYISTVHESSNHAESGLQGKDVSSTAGCINRLLPSTLR